MKRRIVFSLLAVILLWGSYLATTVATAVATAVAHGGGVLQVSDETAGPYRVTVWTSPAIIRAERPVHVTVGVVTADGQWILNADVQVELIPPNAVSPLLSAPATTAQSTNKLFYEADITPSESGLYHLNIGVFDAAGEGGQIEMSIDIRPPETNWLAWGLVVLIGLTMLFGLLRGWRGSVKAVN